MKKNRWYYRTVFIAALFLLTLISTDGHAGWFSEEEPIQETSVDVTVNRVTHFGVLQVIDTLLGKIDGVKSVRMVRQHVDPAGPEHSFTTWEVRLTNHNGLYLGDKLYQHIELLDENSMNDIVDESTFSIAEENYKLVKQIGPIYATLDTVYFTAVTSSPHAAFHIFMNTRSIHPDHPWQSLPGAGFE